MRVTVKGGVKFSFRHPKGDLSVRHSVKAAQCMCVCVCVWLVYTYIRIYSIYMYICMHVYMYTHTQTHQFKTPSIMRNSIHLLVISS